MCSKKDDFNIINFRLRCSCLRGFQRRKRSKKWFAEKLKLRTNWENMKYLLRSSAVKSNPSWPKPPVIKTRGREPSVSKVRLIRNACLVVSNFFNAILRMTLKYKRETYDRFYKQMTADGLQIKKPQTLRARCHFSKLNDKTHQSYLT